MARKFTVDELKWGGTWGLIGPVADFPDPVGPWWEILTEEARKIVLETKIRQRIELSKFVMAQMKEDVAMLEKVLSVMKTKG